MDDSTKTKQELLAEIEALREENNSLRRTIGGVQPAPLSWFDRIHCVSGDIMSFVDRNYVYRAINDVYSKAFGVPREQILGKTVADILGPDVFHNVIKKPMDRCLQGEEVTYQAWFELPGLGRTFRDVTYRPFFEADGHISGVLISSVDITKEKLAKEAHSESESRYRTIAQISPAAITIHHKGVILFANEAAGTLLGTSDSNKLVGLQVREVIHENSMAKVEHMIGKDEDRPKTAEPIELKLRRLDGEERYAQIALGTVIYEGAPATMCVSLDITAHKMAELALLSEIAERKKAEERSEMERKRLFNLLERLPALVYVMRPDHVIEYASRQMHELAGVAETMRPCWEMFGHSRRCDDCPSLEVLRTGKPMQWEWTSESGRTFQINDYPFQDADGSERVLGIGMDITDLTLATRELLFAKEAAEQANQAKSSFLANMSHEIRTPISGILGIAEMMLASPIGQEQIEHVNMIKDSTRSLLAILNDILDFSKIEAGKVDLTFEDFDLESELRKVCSPFAYQASRKGVKLTVHSDPLPCKLNGDCGRLGQVVRNLLGNAVKFTEQGEIQLRSRVAREEADRVEVEISVQDTGVGVPESLRPHLFESFTQAEEHSKRYAGSGLGLAISRQLIEMMGGSIRFEPGTDGGSQFICTLPFKSTEKHAANGSHAATADGAVRSLRLLLAEDNKPNRVYMRHFLVNQGHEVEVVENGAQAVAALAETDFDAVLMDIMMPEMDGIEATRRIRAGMGGVRDTEVPIIALTAFAMKGDKERLLETGMDGYVTKPVDKTLLMRTLGETLAARGRTAPKPREPGAAPLPRPQAQAPASNPDSADSAATREIITCFLEDTPERLERLKAALADGDMASAADMAHGLVSSLVAVKAKDSVAAARALEHAARENEKDKALERLDIFLRRVEALLAHFQEQGCPPEKG